MKSDDLPRRRARAMTLRAVARAVIDGEVDLGPDNSAEALAEQLVAIKGIGVWTAQYVAMRAHNDPDAFLHSDLVIRRAAKQHLGIGSDKELLAYSEQWRPWRAYACLHLWRTMTQQGD
ncbi:MAG: DNA-3-methyladenine glycosylase 2 family protein [Pseudomonadales bacterium]|nr:DNA-3-methyladenine glycosylase 2 family protein [Pseudomonadales bacterium]